MSKTALAIDDSDIAREYVGLMLGRIGFGDIAFFGCPRKACEHMEAAETAPELFILDTAMPGPDGLKLCGRLRGIDKLDRTRILMPSSMRRACFAEAALGAGADEYLPKSLSFREVQDRIKSALAHPRP